jgi:hypothetical protein
MEIVSFKAEHLTDLAAQPAQAQMSDKITPQTAAYLEGQSSFTALVDGRPIGAAGVLPQWEHRALAWAYLSVIPPRQFLLVHRAVEAFLESCYVPRLEMTVDCEFEQGHRWARLLGFTCEAERMARYTPEGRDCALYARIR